MNTDIITRTAVLSRDMWGRMASPVSRCLLLPDKVRSA